MIRLIRRRLIIPRGDTGSFSIPTLGSINEGDIAVFGIFDTLTHKAKVIKMIYATAPTLTFILKSEDTIHLEPKKYNWDISIYHSPILDEDGELIGAAEINSYYSAFKLPICEIKEVALDMCKERWNTRDLLMEAQNPSEPTSYISSIKSVYPWENMQLSFFAGQLYTLAKEGGYEGTIEDFTSRFGNLLEEKNVEYINKDNFPEQGETSKLYFDTNEKILYYWDGEYYPVNTTLITNTVIAGGGV